MHPWNVLSSQYRVRGQISETFASVIHFPYVCECPQMFTLLHGTKHVHSFTQECVGNVDLKKKDK